ncbi:glycogen synthase GlgA [Devosia sp. 63-57]|uniref:glycogen synthase GlgA n=1 Tax=Devosia sp. 63-57 TaxID=1895751 RepID=UPI0008695BE5|nr:glycogen synthase GlgA [Devosia sp. 63-57]ODT50695.1 MAG: starch synthase [Pelagibacterium sp. SCN 63-126]ODU88681.1 MAG: starch synthase [Pelagibacterium sp. SCN 63-17]OJX45806.1 MAG: starch synthase [Devosia sp. 63-57]
MEVLSVTSEVYPLIKTGGLADVAGALPGALSGSGVTMRTLVPGYPAVMARLSGGREVASFADLFGVRGRLVAGRVDGLDLIVLDAPALYDRPGNPYVGPEGWDWPDNWKRFAALSWVASELGLGLVEGYRPQVIHAHDWQAGLVPAYVKYGPSPTLKTVMTVHNMAFQGTFGAEIFGQLRLPEHAFSVEGVEYYGGVGYLKAGVECADVVTTVSPSYAGEIRTPAFGMGLEGLLNNRSATVFGVLNGIDMDAWNPATDPALAQTYTASTMQNRLANKRAVQEAFGLDQADGPLFAVVSRLTWQKGIDLLAANIDLMVAEGAQLAVLGSGDAELENAVRSATMRHPGRVGLVTGYNEKLSHLVQGGADVMMVPSRFEPCGLTQLYALRYGCVPLVSRVGGLNDTVIDANVAALQAEVATGVQFAPPSETALADAIRRTLALYADEKSWKKMQRRGMKSDVSWATSAARYAQLYASLIGLSTDDSADD